MSGPCHFQAFGPGRGERPPAGHDLRLWPEFRHTEPIKETSEMATPDRACPDYPNECMHPWAHARTYAEVKAAQTGRVTEQELEEIELRALMATREPWHVEYLGEHGYPQRIANDAAVVVATTYEGTRPAGNAEFIAAARTDIVRLIAEVRRLNRETR